MVLSTTFWSFSVVQLLVGQTFYISTVYGLLKVVLKQKEQLK